MFEMQPSVQRNQPVIGPATYGARQTSWRHPSIPPYPNDQFTKMTPTKPEAPPMTPDETIDFLMERLPSQGSLEKDDALRERLKEHFRVAGERQQKYEADLRDILGHHLDDPRQNIHDQRLLHLALERATPEERSAYDELCGNRVSEEMGACEDLLDPLDRETKEAFGRACGEGLNLGVMAQPPSYHELFPLPEYGDFPTPAYGEHTKDEIVTPEREAQLPESAFTRRSFEDSALEPEVHSPVPVSSEAHVEMLSSRPASIRLSTFEAPVAEEQGWISAIRSGFADLVSHLL